MNMDMMSCLRASLMGVPAQEGGEGVRAAVLVPIIAGPQPELLFTRRATILARHSGQVSFPGGRCEVQDASPFQTALREAQEETGIAPAFVTLAGYLPRLHTVTGFDVQPVVGVLSPGFVLTPDANEVAEIFKVPLGFFRDPINRQQEAREQGGHQRIVYRFSHDGREIWGATAAIIVNLVARLDAIEAP
jgi:8-oxo-dGTP pyrophosphatase MutT (NUDIX family)